MLCGVVRELGWIMILFGEQTLPKTCFSMYSHQVAKFNQPWPIHRS